MEPNAKIKSGLFAFALGVSATVAGAGGFFALENSAFAQNYQPNHTRTLADGLSNPAGVNAPLPSDSQVGVPENIKTQKNQLLLTARQALAYGDMNTAERKVSELAQMNLTYTKSEDQPTYVLELVNQHKNALQSLQSEGATETNRRIYADVLTREALALMLYNDLDNAEMLAQRAFEQGLMYSAEAIGKGHDPQSILKRIQDKRIAARGTNRAPIQGSGNSPVSGMVQKQIIESGKILAQARMALQNGRIEQAEQFLRQAVAYGIPDSHYPQGADTPGQLRVDLSRARVSQSEYAQVNHEFISPASNRNGAPGGSTVHALYNSGNDTSRIRQVGSSDYNEFDFPVIQGEAEPLPAYGSQMQSGGILAEADRVSTNLTEQIRAEMARDISVAYRIRNDNPQEALNVLFNARAKIENSDLDPLQKQMCLRQIDFSVDATQRYMDTNRPRIEMVEVNRKVLEEIQANREDKAFLEQKLKELCEQVNACLDDGRHEDAMYLANKAYELAPDDPTAKLLYTTTRMQHEALYYDQTKRLKEEGFYNAMMAVDRAAIPYGFEKGPLVIDDLETRTRALGRQGIDESIRSLRSERELEIIRKIETPIRLDFEDLVPLEAVISHIQGYTGIVIVPDPNALQELDITMDQMVRAQLPTEIKLRSALNLLLKPMGLTYIVEDEVLKITTPSRAKGRMRVERYYIGDLVVPVQSLTASSTHSLEASHERAMHRTYGRNQGGPGNVRGASFTGAQNANGILDQSVLASLNPQINPGGMIAPNNLDYLNQYGQRGGASVDASSIIGLIESVTGEDGAWDDAPPPTFYQNTLSLVIRQTEEVHTEIADLLKQLRKLNDLQVTVEVRFITLSDNFFERMGVDFQANFRNNGASNKAWFESGTSDSGNSNNNNNNSSSNNSNSSSNNSNSNSNSNNNNNNSSSSSSGTSVHGNDVTVGLSAPGIFTANFDVPLTMGHYAAATPVFGGFSPDAGASLGFAILSDIEAFFFMNAAQGDTRSNVLQAPKITLFNGLPGTIEDTTQTPFVTGVRPVVGDFAAAYEPIITILTEGSTLHVQAVVDNDRQHVRVTLNPVFSQITNKTNTFRYDGETAVETDETSRTRGDAENPANSDEYDTGVKTVARQSGVTIQQPVVASVMVSTTVSVPDGGTILLGGVKRLSEGRTEQGVPIVNKIPFLNRLFMNTAIGRETSSLMFMVTPRILIQEEEELFINGSTSTNF